MHVSDVMTWEAECIQPEASVQEAAMQMKRLNVGVLPVCEANRLTGILTDRDIAVRAVATGLDPRTTKVREIMTSNVISCGQDQDINEVARLMQDAQIRRVMVVDRDKRLLGIVSLGDLATYSGDTQLVGKVLHEVSEPAKRDT
jgi:CBS domain-containing protein